MDEHDDLVVALTPLIDVLERLGVTWYVGGSVASTVHGRFRATNDVDVIADLREEHAGQLRGARREVPASVGAGAGCRRFARAGTRRGPSAPVDELESPSMPASILPGRWTDKQVPKRDQIFLDHVGSFVGDLDRAATTLRRLGFEPSAVSRQRNVAADGTVLLSGTSNRLVRLRRGFLEFLASTSDTPLAEQLRRALAKYEGLHLIAFSHADLEAQRARLVEVGFDMQSMVRLRGRTTDPDRHDEVAWSILRTMPHVMPEGRIQFVYPHMPDLSWPSGSTDHPNHADGLTCVILCVEEPDETKDRFGAYLGRTPDSVGVTTDRGRVHIVGPEDAGDFLPNFVPPSLPCIAAVTVMTTDLDETLRVVRNNGIVPLGQRDGILWISPTDALGCYLGFHQDDLVRIEDST